MTLIVAVETAKDVVIGADSFFGNEDWRDALDRPKYVFRGKDLCLAFAGDNSYGQLAESIPRFPKRPRKGEDDVSFILRAIVTPIRKAHADHGLPLTGDNLDFAGLVVLKRRVYTICTDYTVMRSKHGYAAIGIAAPYAMGSLATTDEDPAEVRVEKALKAAMRHSSSICRPFNVDHVPRAKKPTKSQAATPPASP